MAEREKKSCEYMLKGLSYEILQGDVSTMVGDLVYNTNAVTPGCIFVCIK